MTYTPTKETLELAALACGKTVYGVYSTDGDGALLPKEIGLDIGETDCILWQPHLPTTQGKADLLDMMLVAGLEYAFSGSICHVWKDSSLVKFIEYSGKQEDKHAALAEAALKVAAMVGAKMKGGV